MPAPLGNDNARRGKEWTLALRRAMARRASGDYRETLDMIADKVVAAALEGDREAWREIADREDGKPTQAINASTEVNVGYAEQLERARTRVRLAG